MCFYLFFECFLERKRELGRACFPFFSVQCENIRAAFHFLSLIVLCKAQRAAREVRFFFSQLQGSSQLETKKEGKQKKSIPP